MLKNPEDKRAKKTALQIKNTTFDFMEKKEIHEIKVSEICNICQINRATFYDHYKDVFDLVQEMEKDILRQLQNLMLSVSPEETSSEEVCRLFLDFLTQYKRELKLLLKSERGLDFTHKLDNQLIPFFEQKIRQNFVVPSGMDFELQCAMQFVATSYYRFFFQILMDDSKHSSDKINLYVTLSNACLSSLFSPK